jgi:ATP-dependent helicase HrpB
MLQPLPIDPLLPEIVDAVRAHACVILTATPGAGKTTRLPPELLNAVAGKVLVLEPRRMAAVAAASRIAEERGWNVGREVGYQVRFESKTSSATRLNFVTDALALRMLIDDSELQEVDLVVIDEFHERNLNQDLMLGCLRELQELGRGIKILVMSATLDTARLRRFLPGSFDIDVPGKVYPLEVRNFAGNTRVATDPEFFDRICDAVVEGVRGGAGDILVFLPGVGEIARARDRLEEKRLGREIQVLHGSLALNEQQRVLRKSSSPRVILATNVAEASVTVDGVDYVVDSGLAKVLQTNAKTGFSQLELSRISEFNARQRAGRAARQKAGVCVRLWSAFEESAMEVEPSPECHRVDLSQALLLLGHLGVSDFSGFAWFDPPPSQLMAMAVRSLKWLGAIDSEQRLTELGRKLIRYPLPPRLGALMVLGEAHKPLAARLAALLSERDLLDRGGGPTTLLECDLLLRLEMLEDFESGKARHLGARAQGVLDVAKQLGGGRLDKIDAKLERRLLLFSQRDRLCRRRGKSERALMVGGRGVKLSPDSQVKNSEFFVALHGIDFPGQPDTTISQACGLSKEFILEMLGSEVKVREDVHFDEDKEKFFMRRGRFIDDLPIEEPSLTPIDPAQIGEKLVEVLLAKWDWLIEKNESLRLWLDRVCFLSRYEKEFAEILGEDFRRQVLEMAAFGKTGLAQVAEQDFSSFIETVLGRDLVRKIEGLVPTHYLAPSGFKQKIDYSEGHSAFVDVRLQEMFSQLETPKILGGRLPLTFRLLGPNYRPVQVTSDLASFWRNGYLEVRKDLRARYPKHSWPEDPKTAKPEAKGRRR